MRYDIEVLKKLLFEEHKTYKEVGKMYGVTDMSIRKFLQRKGIVLPHRKDTSKKFCLNCGKEITKKQKWTGNIYCNNKCQCEYQQKQRVARYQESGVVKLHPITDQPPQWLRKYILAKFDNKCCLCGWSEINPFTNTSPLEMDHINGNPYDNREENLRILCPNCHSLTATYRGANKGQGRYTNIKNRDVSPHPDKVLKE